MEDKKPVIEQALLPPGLKTRPGTAYDKTKRLPSMSSLLSQIQSGSGSGPSNSKTNTAAVAAFTKGGVAKRVFKPKIPSERIKQETNDTKPVLGPNLNGTSKDSKAKAGRIKTERKPIKGKEKEIIQIKGTFEGFKVEPKKRDSCVSYGSSRGGGGGGGASSSKSSFIKSEPNGGDSFGKSGADGKDRRKYYESDDEMEVDQDLNDSDSGSDQESSEKPICWNSKQTNSLTVKSEANSESLEDLEKRTKEELKRGKLILLPMIFGTSSGDTDYKLQVLRSGRMRLVNKTTGFCIDLVNAAPSGSNGSTKEVIEVDGDKLIRYGTITDQDIYAPIRVSN